MDFAIACFFGFLLTTANLLLSRFPFLNAFYLQELICFAVWGVLRMLKNEFWADGLLIGYIVGAVVFLIVF